MKNSIGIFDSGVGGLSVLKAIRDLLPNENLIYVGDNARSPYGSRSIKQIRTMSLEIGEFLLQQEVKMIVIACNSASIAALEELQEKYDIPIIGVVKSGATAALATTRNNRVGIIGTKQTIKSQAHKTIIETENLQVITFNKATPLFALIVEEGLIQTMTSQVHLKETLAEFHGFDIDTLLLGCTHYSLLKDDISRELPGVTIVDPAQECAKEIKKTLLKRKIANHEPGDIRLFVTEESRNFINFAQTILSTDTIAIETIDLENRRIPSSITALNAEDLAVEVETL